MKYILPIFFQLILAFAPFSDSKGQAVSISTTGAAPDTTSILDVKSTTKGVLLPRMTSVQRAAIGAPADGLFVYDITTHSPWYRNIFGWQNMGVLSAPPPLIVPLIYDMKIVMDQQQMMIESQQAFINHLNEQNEFILMDLKRLQMQVADIMKSNPGEIKTRIN